ncbi:MAG: lysophospholipid acyltransferase family protein [Spartobacteria bacterium]
MENSSTGTDRPLRDSLRVNAAYALYLASASWLTASVLLAFSSGRNGAASLRARQKISSHSARYLDRLARMGCIRCVYEGFEDCADWRSSLICANHPSIFDALLLFQKFPNAGCVVGANPRKHPLFSILARQAAYIPSLPALGMVKETRKFIAHGGNIMVFPEGTRTREGALARFQDGFALAAIKSGAAVRTIFIECTSRFLGKAISLRSPLEMPIHFRLSTGDVFRPGPDESARAFSHALEEYFRARLVREGEAIRRSEFHA